MVTEYSDLNKGTRTPQFFGLFFPYSYTYSYTQISFPSIPIIGFGNAHSTFHIPHFTFYRAQRLHSNLEPFSDGVYLPIF